MNELFSQYGVDIVAGTIIPVFRETDVAASLYCNPPIFPSRTGGQITCPFSLGYPSSVICLSPGEPEPHKSVKNNRFIYNAMQSLQAKSCATKIDELVSAVSEA